MRMYRGLLISTLWLTCCLQLHGESRVQIPVTVLGQRADAVVVASVAKIEGGPGGPGTKLELTINRVLRGPISSLTLETIVAAPSQDISATQFVPSSIVGNKGVWFLRLTQDGYHVIPTVAGVYRADELCMPLPRDADSEAPAGTLNQQLLAYMIRWYQSLAKPTNHDDNTLLDNLQGGNLEDLLVATSSLIRSGSAPQRIVGLTAAIRLGSDDAIAAVAEGLPTLSADPRFPSVTDAIRNYYQPHGVSSIGVLRGLVALHSDVPNLDAAAGAALAKIRAKDVALVMVQLLDSKDAEAQLRAASFLGYYALFADAGGNLPEGGVIGPFATADTKVFTPRRESTITPAEYARFWKQWWMDNRNALGFGTR